MPEDNRSDPEEAPSQERPIDSESHAVTKNTKSNHGDQQTKPMTRFEMWQIRLAVAAASLGLLGLLIIYKQTLIMDTQTELIDSQQRPYIGVGLIVASHTGSNMRIRAAIENFGALPALNCKSTWRIFLDGVEEKMVTEPDTPHTHFPGGANNFGFQARIGTTDYRPIMGGEKILEIQITTSYEWSGNQQGECQRYQYQPESNSFLILGTCTTE